jgi:transglutaminase-like putative cysteine protease
MEYSVRHRTTYRYMQEVSHSRHLVHLAPRDTATQAVKEFRLQVTPATALRTSRMDYFGNPTEWLALYEPHMVINISAESRISATAPIKHNPNDSDAWEEVRARLETIAPETHEIVQYLFDSPLTVFTADLPGYAADSFTPGRPVLAAALDLMSRIHEDFRYDTTVTDASTPVDRVFKMRAGVCQDLAHIGIAAMRSLGLPARYISGYLLTRPPPGQERLIGADASHAWFSVWAPPFGWIDLDPTNNLIPGEGHITVGWGRDYSDVAPINGIVTGGGDHLIEVGVDVIPVE